MPAENRRPGRPGPAARRFITKRARASFTSRRTCAFSGFSPAIPTPCRPSSATIGAKGRNWQFSAKLKRKAATGGWGFRSPPPTWSSSIPTGSGTTGFREHKSRLPTTAKANPGSWRLCSKNLPGHKATWQLSDAYHSGKIPMARLVKITNKNSDHEPVRQELLMQTPSKAPPEHGYARLDGFAPPDKWEGQYLP